MIGSTLQLRVVALHDLAPDLRQLRLAAADGGLLPPAGAGAHLQLKLPGRTRVHRNAYSLVSPPGSRRHYELIVRRVPASRGGSAAVHERLQPGDLIEAQWPANLFAPVRTARRHLLIAGGIGITPFLSYLHDADVRRAGYALHVCCRAAERAVYAPWLSDAAGAPLPGVQFHSSECGDRLDIAALLAAQPAGTHVYVCGPATLNEAVLSTATATGWPADHLHTEHFGGGASGGAAFEAVLQQSGLTLQVAEDESLLEAIERAGVPAASLCRGGACGVCVTPLLAGEAEHRDHCLSAAERAGGGLILPCVSRARSARLVLDL